MAKAASNRKITIKNEAPEVAPNVVARQMVNRYLSSHWCGTLTPELVETPGVKER